MSDTANAVVIPDPNDRSTWPPAWWEILKTEEAERVSSLSWDSILNHHADKVIHLSPRRSGLRRGDAIGLSYKR
jgi:hypothetical protein